MPFALVTVALAFLPFTIAVAVHFVAGPRETVMVTLTGPDFDVPGTCVRNITASPEPAFAVAPGGLEDLDTDTISLSGICLGVFGVVVVLLVVVVDVVLWLVVDL